MYFVSLVVKNHKTTLSTISQSSNRTVEHLTIKPRPKLINLLIELPLYYDNLHRIFVNLICNTKYQIKIRINETNYLTADHYN